MKIEERIIETCKECHGEGTIRKLALVPSPPKRNILRFYTTAFKIIAWDILCLFFKPEEPEHGYFKSKPAKLTMLSWILIICEAASAFVLFVCFCGPGGADRVQWQFLQPALVLTAPWALAGLYWTARRLWNWIGSVVDRARQPHN